jgi:hypothetical protein
MYWHHDIQHNDIRHNDIQPNDTRHKGIICDTERNDIQHNTLYAIIVSVAIYVVLS